MFGYLIMCFIILNRITTINTSNDNKIGILTGTNLIFTYVELNTTFVKFQVKSEFEVRLGFFTEPSNKNMFEVVLGAAKNTKSLIKKNGHEVSVINTSGILNKSMFCSFWVRYCGQIIELGLSDEPYPFIVWKDQKKLPKFKYLGLNSKLGSTSEWRLSLPNDLGCEENCLSLFELFTPDDRLYNFFEISGKTFSFRVKAPHDAHIGLFSSADVSNIQYEILIGGWDNTRSVIKSYRQEVEDYIMVAANTTNILKSSIFTSFWVRLVGHIIAIGLENEEEPFLTWRDKNPLPKLSYIGVHTGFGSIGEWILDIPQPDWINNEEYILNQN